jgi:hypothetical protein
MRFDPRYFNTWLERVDPGARRRVKGLRLVTAYGIAMGLGTLQGVSAGLPANVSAGTLAGGFALWASVSEAQTARYASTRDLAILCVAAALGAVLFALLAPLGGTPVLVSHGLGGGEWILVTGAFFAGLLKRYGTIGAGVGSQIYIGQLLAYGAHLGPGDLGAIAISCLIAILAAAVPRLLSGPAELPAVPATASASVSFRTPSFLRSAELAMGVQAALAAAIVVVLHSVWGLVESAWAITACVYVVTATAAGTLERVRRRIVGTLVGVPLGLACLPAAEHAPLLVWVAASLAMIVYAMALPERYDVACGAFAFALVVTLAATGEHSIAVLVARAWETVLGGALGIAMAVFVFPVRAQRSAAADASGDNRGPPGPG